MHTSKNELVSQSRIIIPRGIINFNRKKSLSVERQRNELPNYDEGSMTQLHSRETSKDRSFNRIDEQTIAN